MDGRRPAVISTAAALLAAAVLFALWPILANGFVLFDDTTYVTGNPVVLGGISLPALRWAFTTFHGANWHPLTWVSHLLEVTLFGLDPSRHHAVSLGLHLASSLALLLLLRAMSGRLWLPWGATLLFAVHPLRVESVAWVAERKDVLSVFLFLLALGAWIRHVRRPSPGRYLVTSLLMAAGLMAKPMVVTLPVVLLILDFWPLARLGPPGADRRSAAVRLAVEKVPLLILSLASSMVTYLAQKGGGAVMSMGGSHSALTIPNAFLSYLAYLGLTLRPAGLAVYYPLPPTPRLPLLSLAAVALLAALTAAAIRRARRRPFLLAGWSWYLVTLLPVIGLVKVGGQALADRYTYLPSVGLSLLLLGLAGELTLPGRRFHLALGTATLTILFSLLTRHQARTWRDEYTLMAHAARVTTANWMVHNNLGLMLARRGLYPDAETELRRSVAISANPKNLSNLAGVLLEQGRLEDAEPLVAQAVALDPADTHALLAQGAYLSRRWRNAEAEGVYRRALAQGTDRDRVLAALAGVVSRQGRAEEAIAHYREALLANPLNASVHNDLGVELMARKRSEEAIARYREALRLDPGHREAMGNLGNALFGQGRHAEAADWYRRLLHLDPENRLAEVMLRRSLDLAGGARRP
jgi:Flp pilus assembly protein TadD